MCIRDSGYAESKDGIEMKRLGSPVLFPAEDNFEELTAIDSILYGAGEFVLHDSDVYKRQGIDTRFHSQR